MKLKAIAGGVEAVVTPKGPGEAVLDLSGAYSEDGGSTGVNIIFKRLSGSMLASGTLEIAESNAMSTRFMLGPKICNALAEDGQNFYNLSVEGIEGEIRVQVRGRLAVSSNKQADEVRAEPKSADVPKSAEPQLKSAHLDKTAENVSAPKKSKSLIFIVLISLIALLFAAALLWYFLFAKDDATKPQIQESATTVQQGTKPMEMQISSAAPASVVASKCDLSLERNDKLFLKACLDSAPSSDELMQTAQQAMDGGRCDIAIRIYSSLGRTGNEKAALLYARYLDPKESLSSSCVKKDESAAAYWYEKGQKTKASAD